MTSETYLYEILVPCQWNDGTPIRTRHHKAWDEKVRAVSGGLTVYTPAKGQWEHEGELFAERVIPVRILCTREQMAKIVDITMVHYEQLAVMCYIVAITATVIHATPAQKARFSRERSRPRD